GAQFRTDALKDDYLTTITPEKVEKEWGSWKDDYLGLAYEGNDWRKLINDLRRLWIQEIYIPDKKVESIDSKVMIVFGDHDIIKLEHGVQMYKAIKNSELLILPNTGHNTYGERAELITKIALEFYNK
ncbi:MAG: alpha/beta hydrolase, partial [Cyclobacteriaceae bacterium]|nr:alpha/beta hydrolase [Cyclobacteriaceae bacterium]